MPDPVERRLAAIMFTDIVGSTALMAKSEPVAMRVKQRHRTLVRTQVDRYHGEFIEAPGDETLSIFGSALDAVSCALAIQTETEAETELRLHIGVHSGDVLRQGPEIHGDGVNVASRVCRVSEQGGVCVSGEVYKSIRNQPGIEAVSLGERELKNVPEPVAVYSVTGSAAEPGPVSSTVPRARWTLPALAAVAAIGLVVGGWLYRPTSSTGAIRSIAVLPLENLSGDPEQEYFADGMTEALISALAKIRSLRVISRTSVMLYKGARKPLPEIAEELDVNAVLEGTVARSESRVRITAQLIDARSDHHLWAETYERDLKDVLALQGQVATAIAREIRLQLTPEERTRLAARTVDPAVHDLYLRGRFLWNKRSPEALRQAIDYFERVIEADPEHASGHAGLADASVMLSFYEGTDPRFIIGPAKERAQRALAIDPSLAEAHASLAMIQTFFEWRLSEAEAGFLRAIELDPSYAPAHYWYGELLMAAGRNDEAIARLEHARRLDPLSAVTLATVGLSHAGAQRYEAALEALRVSFELDPGYALARGYAGETYLSMGRTNEAVSELERALKVSGGQPAFRLMLARAYARSDRHPEAREILRDVVEGPGQAYFSPFQAALLYRELGDDEKTFEWLEKAYESRDPFWLLILSTFHRDLQSERRYQALLRRLGLPES